MPKVMTVAQIAEKRAAGATIERETRQVELQGVENVVSEFKRMADSMDVISKKRNNDLLEAINNLTQAVKQQESNVNIDMSQIAEIVKELKQPKEKIPYRFEINRDSRGLTSYIDAVPQYKEIH